MNRLRELVPEQTLEQLCALFGKTRQAYYQRLNYNYQEYAEDGIILDLIAEYREDMGRLGGRNYYKTHESPEQTKEKILSLTTDVRTPIQTSGL